mmetsp:Transcript_96666/g.207443  ORF Transcript_96666/g.207443 Transcript_96666/m.207443 type:complete len:216 (+) Transcript_96666:96-743(+)
MGSVCLRPEETPRRSSDGGPQMPEPVVLHVYDIGTSGIGRALNQVLRPLGTGVFHCGVEVYGLEWSYSDIICHSPIRSTTGVFSCRPRICDGHSYIESVFMGKTPESESRVLRIFDELKKEWPVAAYDLLKFNCCHFCDEVCRRLHVGAIPEWVTSMASAGASIADKGNQVNTNMCCREVTDTICCAYGTRSLEAAATEELRLVRSYNPVTRHSL